MNDIGTAKMPKKVLTCPFCGKKPTVTPYPNNTGAQVECTTIDCAAWGHKFDLADWNKRSKKASKKLNLIPYLFDVIKVYIGSNFFPEDIFVCNCCKAEHKNYKDIKHKKGCSIGDYLNDTSR